MSAKLNTHSYDGKIVYPEGKEDLKEEKKQKFMARLKNDNAKKMANIIFSGNGNWDKSNKIDALNIFSWIINRRINDDIFSILEEQLSDTLLKGSCPEGRTTRLFQVYLIMREEQRILFAAKNENKNLRTEEKKKGCLKISNSRISQWIIKQNSLD